MPFELSTGSRRREMGEGASDCGGELVAAAVAFVVDDLELASGPVSGQVPGGFERAADVVAAVDEYAGDAVQRCCVVEELAVLEEGGVSPVVRDQARESQ